MFIKLIEGTIKIESCSGVVKDDYFLLYLTLREKFVDAGCVSKNPAVVLCFPTEFTLRPDGAGGYEKVDCNKEKITRIEFPSGWSVEAFSTDHTCRIMGVRTPNSSALMPLCVDADGIRFDCLLQQTANHV